jgi:hypothetical protein
MARMMTGMSAARVGARNGDSGGSATAPTTAGGDGLRVGTLRPRRTLVRSIGLTLVALAFPLLVADLWALPPTGDVRIVTSVVALVFLIAALAWRAYRRTEVVVSELGIVERGFFGQVQVTAARDIAGVLRLELYRGATLDTTRQLFVVDADGRCRFRMRGAFWEDETMDDVARLLGIDETVRPEPVTIAELRRSDSRLLYWFERRPFAADVDTSGTAGTAGTGDT